MVPHASTDMQTIKTRFAVVLIAIGTFLQITIRMCLRHEVACHSNCHVKIAAFIQIYHTRAVMRQAASEGPGKKSRAAIEQGRETAQAGPTLALDQRYSVIKFKTPHFVCRIQILYKAKICRCFCLSTVYHYDSGYWYFSNWKLNSKYYLSSRVGRGRVVIWKIDTVWASVWWRWGTGWAGPAGGG